MKIKDYSARAQILYRDKYCREKDNGVIETRPESYDRVIAHQRRLWEEAQGFPLAPYQLAEIEELREVLYSGGGFLAGRTHWLGGTELAFDLAACQFNCAGLIVETVYDLVDLTWLLLLGCGVGAKARLGTLVGFHIVIPEVEVIRSTRTAKGGREHNVETYEDGIWTLSVGDSAQAWAKAVGKIMIGQFSAHKLVLDLSEIRPAGQRLKGFGWISNGDAQLAVALEAIVAIRNKSVDSMLNKQELHDIINWIGTILSTRRSAEILFNDYDNDDWLEFSMSKQDHTTNGQWQRGQSNNSNIFWRKPTKPELVEYFDVMAAAGGSEPGLINGVAARRRAPWFSILNPCAA